MRTPGALPLTVPLAEGWQVEGVLGDAGESAAGDIAWRDVPEHERRVSVEAWNADMVAA